jgi:uncharacterized protein YcfJ
VGTNEGTFMRVQVGNKDGTFVGTSVVGALLGALVGALVGGEVGSGVNFKITGAFRGIAHWLAVKASETKLPDDPTIRRARRIATERNMVITASSNKCILSLETRQSKCSILVLG